MALVGRFENVVSACIHRSWDDLGAAKNANMRARDFNRGRSSRPALQMDQSPTYGGCRRLASAQHIEFAEDVLQMRFHSAFSDEKMLGDFFVAHTGSDLPEDG